MDTRSILLTAFVVGSMAACDCGQSKPGPGLPDVTLDTPGDTAGDGLTDVPDEVLDDPLGDAGDVTGDDGGPALAGTSFRCETSGGGALSSESYSMDLFIGPVRPLGHMSSDSYQMKLGPAGMRSP